MLATVGMLILAAGLCVLARLESTSSVGFVMTGHAVVGVGTGIFISPNNSALMGAAPPHEQGISGGILATARNVGMVLGVGLLTHAVDVGFWVTAGLALLGSVTSFVRSR